MKQQKLSKKEVMDHRKLEKVVNKASLDRRNGKGDHAVVYSPDGTDSFTYCQREMGYGLACSIWKKLLSWGVIIGILLGGCWLVQQIP